MSIGHQQGMTLLGLSKNTEDFCSTLRAGAFHGTHTILHRGLLAILNLNLFLTFHASSFYHVITSR